MSSLVAICNTCPIPDALEARQSCLNLVPMRRFPGWKRSLPMVQSQTSQAPPLCADPVHIGSPALHANSSPTTGRRHKKCCGL